MVFVKYLYIMGNKVFVSKSFLFMRAFFKVIFFSLIFSFALLEESSAQSYQGFREGNFSGVLGVSHQPASILDYPANFDFMLIGASSFMDNNIVELKRENPFFNLDTEMFKSELLRHNSKRFAYTENEQSFLAFMWKFKNNQAIAFVPKVRTIASFRNVSPDYINYLFEPTKNVPTQVSDLFYKGQEGSAFAMSWNELAITYSKELFKNKLQKMSFGVTPKFLYSNAATYLELENLEFTSPLNGDDRVMKLKASYGASSHLGTYQSSGWSWKPEGDFGLGFDFGLRYERLSSHSSSPTYDGARGRRYKPRQLLYSYRIDFTILDVGRVSFKESKYGSQINGFTGSRILSPADIRAQLKGVKDFKSLQDSLSNFLNIEENSGDFSIGLPTTINLSIDKNLNNGFYLNAGIHLPLPVYPASYKLLSPANLTLAFRWESYFMGVYMPNYLNINGHFTTGLALRVGPLILGIQDIQPFLYKEEVKTAGAYAALKFFILPKKDENVLPCFGKPY